MSTKAIIRIVTVAPDLPPLQGVQLPDKRVGATLRSLCSALSIDLSSQMKRLHRQPLFDAALVSGTLATAGGLQEMDVLLAWAIPLWVIGIQVKRLDVVKRAHIFIIQTQAVEALYRAFWHEGASAEEATEAEVISRDGVEGSLEGRLAAVEARQASIEAALREQAGEAAGLEGRLGADERLLAATIERLLSVERRVRVLEGSRQVHGARRQRRRTGGRRKSSPDWTN